MNDKQAKTFKAIATAYVVGAIVLFALLSILFPDAGELTNLVTASAVWLMAIVGAIMACEWWLRGAALPKVPLAASLQLSIASLNISVSAQVGYGAAATA